MDYEQVYEIHKIIKFEKIYALTTKNLCNFNVYQMIKISLVLCNTYIVSRHQNKFMFYIYYYINWDLLNQLYDSN